MTGKVVVSNNLVQTFSSIEFELRPTIDLSTESYIKILIPKSIGF